jgi:hypothetical protein
MTAAELITFDELREKLVSLEETRVTAVQELDALSRRQKRVAALERDAEALLDSYAGMVSEALDSLAAEERHEIYRMLRLKVLAHPDKTLDVSGVIEAHTTVCGAETKR